VSWFEDETDTFVQLIPPKLTVVPETKPNPVRVIVVPPAEDAVLGLT
jgi:hypothetical protein